MSTVLTSVKSTAASGARAQALYELSKPNLTGLVVVTSVLGFYLGLEPGTPLASVDWVKLVYLMMGTALTSAGACALNMYIERDLDARMRRTQQRPIPSGRLSADQALAFALIVFAWGFFDLLIFCGPYPALLALLTGLIYGFVYTPLKRRGPISIWVGAVPGAIPPVMGWAAVQGGLGLGGLSLFAVLFVWQFPHFLALAYMYREDYARAGFRFLPDDDRKTGLHIVLGCAALLAASVLPAALGLVGRVYLVGALAFGVAFLAVGLQVLGGCTPKRARRVFFASIIYQPALLALLVLDRFLG